MYTTEKHHAKTTIEDFIEKYMRPEEVLGYCKENHCKHYGAYWCCPPYEFDTLDFIRQFSRIEVVGIKAVFDEKVRREIYETDALNEIIAKVMGEVRLELDRICRQREAQSEGALALLGGSCILCGDEPCARQTDQPCRHGDKMRYSLESLGAMVADITTDMLGFELKWAKAGRLPEYMTLVGAVLLK
ncbi:MAG: hypothetical protein GX061_05640 [Eubacteriaceae bacterium]|nr:hypothetical protein [Eubacteriaceae bacterium]